jgi:hypothetical protein
MPSLKRSETRRRTRGGADPAERLVREAITFLFEIKGEEYSKKHPEFITPTVDEFFTYARSISDALETTRVKKGGYHRKLPIKKHSGGSNIVPFLEFIVPGPIDVSNPCESILRIFNIFLLCLMVYKFVMVFMRERMTRPGIKRDTLLANVQRTITDPEYTDSFADPVRWFCSKIAPALNSLRDDIQQSIGRLLEYISGTTLNLALMERFAGHGQLAAWTIGKEISTALNMFDTSPFILNMLLYIPLLCQLAKMGFEGCGGLCTRLLAESKISKMIIS